MAATNNQNNLAVQETDSTVSVSVESAEQNNSEQIVQEHTLFAEPVFSVGQFTVTNSLLSSWVALILIIVLMVTIGSKVKKIPGKLQNISELIVSGAMNVADQVTNDRKITNKVFPLVFAIFVFILFNNWLGILPGVGSIGLIEQHGAERIFVPLLRGATADINTTLALAIFAVLAANIFGILAVGGWNYFNKFINVKALISLPHDVRKNAAALVINPITFFVGLIEIVSEVAKVASLSFRLFGNVFAGEVLLASIAVIFAFALPIPFLFLEVMVGMIQAFIFSMLMLVYFTIASQEHEHE